jgi:uncharacterized protein with ParB-like and HNH nuclease domain
MSAGDTTIRSIITPNDQFLRDVFSIAKAYYVDIYQREYKWKPENVLTLLRDIESRFVTGERTETEPRMIQPAVQEHFEPYFMNTYLTHSTATNIFVVDGQQRLTTFLLIFIRLYQILKTFEAEQKAHDGADGQDPYLSQRTFSSSTLEKLIFESDDFGDATRFKIFNENREATFRQIIEGEQVTPSDETQKRIRQNYDTITKYFEGFLGIKDSPGRYDITKLTYYITYLLDRISIVEIKIERQHNVATIFEVVNDRGLGLKPYEILKGKLIGNLPAAEKESANAVWTQLQDDYFNTELRESTDRRLDLDDFFRTFFRAKFADNEGDYEKFEGAYHYQIYQDPRIRKYFRDFSDATVLYERIIGDIRHFAELYLSLRAGYENEYLIYNKLLDQNQQYLLILSCINTNDEAEEDKITGIARKFDQFHTILRLLDVYESSAFQRLIYPISKGIRGKSLPEAEAVFDTVLIQYLEDAEILRQGEITAVAELFTYDRFQGARNRWTNFSKYVLMRIDRHLAQLLDKPSYVGGSLEDLEYRFNKSTRRMYALHLEHIYAYNESNMDLFPGAEQGFDEQLFTSVRNLLGMVLLLKDSQNISSSNEIYSDKIDTYSKSNFIWNELLVGHLPHVDVKKLPEAFRVEGIQPDTTGAFPRDKVGERQRVLFDAIKLIWCDSVPPPTD